MQPFLEMLNNGSVQPFSFLSLFYLSTIVRSYSRAQHNRTQQNSKSNDLSPEWNLRCERVSVIDDRVSVVAVPAVELHAAAAGQQHLENNDLVYFL